MTCSRDDSTRTRPAFIGGASQTTWTNREATTEEIAPPPLQLLGGRYRVLGPVGRGGTAWVYRVRDEHTGQTLAAKVLRTELHGVEQLQERFAAEACAMTILDHPHVARVHDMGCDDATGAYFTVLEWLGGGSLRQELDLSGAFAPERAVATLLDVLSALAVAHARGIVHRDVKAGNVLLDEAGTVKVVDFGIARIPDAGGETDVDIVMGSFATMAPEQRVSASSATVASDVYAAGALLYQLVTNATPVDLFAVPAEHPRWELVPPALIPVIRKATGYAPESRFGSAREMADALRAVDLRP